MAINISTRDRLYVSNEAKSRVRKSAAASAAGGLDEQRCAATVNASRSIFLGDCVKDLVSPARRTTYRPAGNRNPIAPIRISPALGTHMSKTWASADKPEHSWPYRKPPSQTWRTFLEDHATDLFAIDFLTVPTATFRVLFVLVILSHDRRKIVHTNATERPTAIWTAQQVLEAIGIDDSPKYLLRDNDAIYGNMFRQKVAPPAASRRQLRTLLQ